MRALIAFVFLFFVCASTWPNGCMAQVAGSHVIHGKVADADSEEGIPGASIFIEFHDHVISYTNDEGSFELKVPGFINEGNILISALGFEVARVPLSGIDPTSELIIHLRKMPIMLDEVVITANRFDLEELCKEALRRMASNYPNKMHMTTGFYRKMLTDSLQYTGLVETVLLIRDPGYQKAPGEIQISALQVRSGDNLIETSAIKTRLGNKMSEHYGVSAVESLHRVYESNLIRLFRKPQTFFDTKGPVLSFENRNGIKETAELENVTITDGDTIVHVRVQTFAGDRKLDAIHLSINARDKAITAFTRRLFEEKVTVSFTKKSNGRYYLQSIHRVSPMVFASDESKLYYNIEWLEVDHVEIEPSRAAKLKNREAGNKSFDPGRFTYDDGFWANYFEKDPRPIEKVILQSLERVRPLDQQFKDAARN